MASDDADTPVQSAPEPAKSLSPSALAFLENPTIAGALLVLIFMAGLMPFIYQRGAPLPGVHDEFSYLLAGQTFAEGRLTNPSPPEHEAFQGFHILVSPSYQSKYLPGIGLQLALGFLIGMPIAGVWLTVALNGLAAYWMSRAIVGPRMAWGIGLIALFHFGLNGYFAHSYWGGSLFLLAGLLEVGGFFRLQRTPTLRASIAFGLGAALMLLTRPLEGGIFSLILTFLLLIPAIRKGPLALKPLIWRGFLPGGVIVAAAAVFLLAYNHRVTGDALRLPYMAYRAQFPTSRLLTWKESEVDRASMPKEFRKLAAMVDAQRPQDAGDWFEHSRATILKWSHFFLPLVLAIPLVFFLLRPGQRRALAWAIAWLLLFRLVSPFLLKSSQHAHYLAAWAAPILAAFGLGMERLADFGSRRTQAIAWSLVIAFLAVEYGHFLNSGWGREPFNYSRFSTYRELLRKELTYADEEAETKDLVFIEYGDAHNPGLEWVYNEANLQEAHILWVHAGDRARDRRVAEAFPDRKIWRVKIDDDRFMPVPLPYAVFMTESPVEEPAL